MSTIKVGIIGCGGIANGKHMPSLKTVAGVEQVAFCDIDASKAEKAALGDHTPAELYAQLDALKERLAQA